MRNDETDDELKQNIGNVGMATVRAVHGLIATLLDAAPPLLRAEILEADAVCFTVMFNRNGVAKVSVDEVIGSEVRTLASADCIVTAPSSVN